MSFRPPSTLVAFTLAAVLTVSPLHAADPSPPRGYSIPLIDLDGQTHRQVIVDREPGQYLGHPTTVLLEDGRTIVTVYPQGHGRGAIVRKRSTDGGKTWSERLPVPENWATSQETPTIHRVEDAQGKKRLIVFSGLYPVRMAVSDDDGHTWTPLRPVGNWGGIVTMGSVEPLRTGPGHYLALFHDDGRFFAKDAQRSSTMTLYKTFSTDGGLTWSYPEAIYGSDEVHLCEPGLIRSPDGRQMAVLLRENRRVRNSHIIFSDDEGRTWSKPRELPGALTGDRHTGKYAQDGRLFISFRDTTHESPTKGDWVGWVGTYEDLLHGREGQYRVRLKDNHKGADCAYPGVEVLPDGAFVTTTYGHWTEGEPPYILCVRFTLDELDALAANPAAAQFARSDRPAIVAHRGLLRHAPENTLAAFRACLELRVGFELDVRRSQDGHLVCIHDETLDRTTDGSGKVAETPLQDFRRLDAGSWFDPAFRGEAAPTVDDVFALATQYPSSDILLAVDLKASDARVERDVVELAKGHKVLDRLLFIGRAISEPEVRRRLRQADPAARIAALANGREELANAISDAHSDWVYVRFVPSQDDVDRIHAAGKRVFIAGPTVAGRERANWRAAAECGVDGILTDHPLALARQLRERRASSPAGPRGTTP
jgi:glycerophosphoryl diester phosphodiesterase